MLALIRVFADLCFPWGREVVSRFSTRTFRMHASLLPSSLAAWIVLVVTLIPTGRTRAEDELTADVLWRCGAPGEGCEIIAYEPRAQKLLITVVDGVRALDAETGRPFAELSKPAGFHATSVAVSAGRVAVAWAAEDKRQRGQIGCYEADTLEEIRMFSAGYLPDMVTFSPDGRYLLAANEGEPTDDYRFDPQASITVIDLASGLEAAQLQEAGFNKFDSQRAELRQRGVRLAGPSQEHADRQATVAEDLEPEYIAVRADSKRAWITLQENNAVAELDLQQARILSIHPLGLKNFRHLTHLADLSETTGLDASDVDGGSRVRHWPVFGLYQPDGIATFEQDGTSYLLTANEGDPRDYLGFSEACAAGKLRERKLQLDPSLPARLFLAADQLGRLEVSAVSGDRDNDGDFDELHCFGSRSFSLWQLNDAGVPRLVFDSGNDFERITAHEAKNRFNANSKPDSRPDERSCLRGPEPESVVVGQVGRHRLAMVGLERTGGVMIYDVSLPTYPRFVKYLPPLLEDGILDCAPEGLVMISAETSPTGKPILVVCNEGSGTTTAYQLAWSYERVTHAH